ncbi:Membrane-bound inhibitor of C-type lysozyme [Nitrosomonas sp. Nm51]|uniref:MliC family protein n=1 Tax=Nitrosomonas sp. Nm51 TaxID=133720 RepID=UPI0008C6AA53|nr:Membrane-bound inhibitor of C-type lysozyme [Nitrosomonas sp. Nm51]
MKIIGSLAISLILLLSACGSSPQEPEGTQASAATPSTLSVHNYRCESGETITAIYPSTDSTTVQYKGSTYSMQIAVSGSGARYVGGELEWWTKGSGAGSEGTLFRHNADGTSGDSVEVCTES